MAGVDRAAASPSRTYGSMDGSDASAQWRGNKVGTAAAPESRESTTGADGGGGGGGDRGGSRDAVGMSSRGDDDDTASRPVVVDLPAAEMPRDKESFTVGVLLLLLVVLLWTGSNFLTNYQLTSGYDKPFAVTYLNTASFTLYLVPFALAFQRRHKQERGSGSAAARRNEQLGGLWAHLGFHLPPGSLWRSSSDRYSHNRQGYAAVATNEDEEAGLAGARRGRNRLARTASQLSVLRPSSIDGRRPRLENISSAQHRSAGDHQSPLDMHQTAVLAAQFMVVWFLANYCLNVALKLTSVASATTLSSASGFFTLALGSLVGVEAFSLSKLGAVTMSFTGVLMVTRADSTPSSPSSPPVPGDGTREPSAPFSGDLFALASAAFYAVYVVLLKKRIRHESRVSMPLFFGFVGLLNIIAMWPIGVLLHVSGAEPVALPHGRAMWAGVLVNMAITVVSDMTYLIAMLKSSPLVATVGLSLTIPLAILGDALRGSHSGGAQAYTGSSIVLASFVAIGLADRATAT